MNKFQYKTAEGNVKGFFNIYQGRDGFIYQHMGNCITKLMLNQIEDLKIDCYSLKDYNHDDFVKAYGLPF